MYRMYKARYISKQRERNYTTVFFIPQRKRDYYVRLSQAVVARSIYVNPFHVMQFQEVWQATILIKSPAHS